LDDTSQLVPLAELAASNKANLRLLGAALYRAGRYEEAAANLDEAAQGIVPTAWHNLFLALAHHRLGHTEPAQQFFQRASAQLKATRFAWPESFQLTTLRREAEALLKGRSPNTPSPAQTSSAQ